MTTAGTVTQDGPSFRGLVGSPGPADLLAGWHAGPGMLLLGVVGACRFSLDRPHRTCCRFEMRPEPVSVVPVHVTCGRGSGAATGPLRPSAARSWRPCLRLTGSVSMSGCAACWQVERSVLRPGERERLVIAGAHQVLTRGQLSRAGAGAARRYRARTRRRARHRQRQRRRCPQAGERQQASTLAGQRIRVGTDLPQHHRRHSRTVRSGASSQREARIRSIAVPAVSCARTRIDMGGQGHAPPPTARGTPHARPGRTRSADPAALRWMVTASQRPRDQRTQRGRIQPREHDVQRGPDGDRGRVGLSGTAASAADDAPRSRRAAALTKPTASIAARMASRWAREPIPAPFA